jgi:hypothetical protein
MRHCSCAPFHCSCAMDNCSCATRDSSCAMRPVPSHRCWVNCPVAPVNAHARPAPCARLRRYAGNPVGRMSTRKLNSAASS